MVPGQAANRLMDRQLDNAIISEIIEMAWDDETSFDQIKLAHGLSENDVIQLMRRELKPSSLRMWRKRVSGRAAKHGKLAKRVR